MWTWLMKRSLRAFEKHYDYDAAYMHQLMRDSPGGFRRFAKVVPLASYRRAAPAEVLSVAIIAAMQAEDCGPCLALSVKKAKEAGVSRQVIQAALEGGAALPPALAEVYQFARAVAQNEFVDDEVRGRLQQQYGNAAVAELALCVAAARVFPTVKRAMGYAQSCAAVPLAAC